MRVPWKARKSNQSILRDVNAEYSLEGLMMKLKLQYFGHLMGTVLEKSVFILIPKKGNAKECSNCHTIALISHTSKVMIKILQARLQQYVNRELPNV